MLQQIVNALRNQDGVNDWLVRHIQRTSQQHYVIGDAPESTRAVTSERSVVTVMNDHPAAQRGEGFMRGEAEVTVLPSDLPHVSRKLEEAVFMAGLTDNPPYGLPTSSEFPMVDLADPE
ncbi:MAG: hypothetical protein JSW37_14360, partial [Anaerolineales bacterium]